MLQQLPWETVAPARLLPCLSLQKAEFPIRWPGWKSLFLNPPPWLNLLLPLPTREDPHAKSLTLQPKESQAPPGTPRHAARPRRGNVPFAGRVGCAAPSTQAQGDFLPLSRRGSAELILPRRLLPLTASSTWPWGSRHQELSGIQLITGLKVKPKILRVGRCPRQAEREVITRAGRNNSRSRLGQYLSCSTCPGC